MLRLATLPLLAVLIPLVLCAAPGADTLERMRRSARCTHADRPHRGHIVIAVPFMELAVDTYDGWRLGAEHVPVLNRYPAIVAARRAALELKESLCFVCSVTVLVPESPELGNHGVREDTEAAELWRSKGFNVEANHDACGASEVAVRFQQVGVQSRTVPSWQTAMLYAAAQIPVKPREGVVDVVLFREAGLNVANVDEWSHSLLLTAAQRDIAGCPIVDEDGRNWHSQGAELAMSPHRGPTLLWRNRGLGASAADRRDAQESVDEAYAPALSCFAVKVSVLKTLYPGPTPPEPVATLENFKATAARHMVSLGSVKNMVQSVLRLNHVVQLTTRKMLGSWSLGSEARAALTATLTDFGEAVERAEQMVTAGEEVRRAAETVDAVNRYQRLHWGIEPQDRALEEQLAGLVTHYAGEHQLLSHRAHISRIDGFMTFCGDSEAHRFLMNVSQAPCVSRTGDRVNFCNDGDKAFQAIAGHYRGPLRDDVIDTATLPTFRVAEEVLRPALRQLEIVNDMVKNGSLPSSFEGCSEGEAGLDGGSLVDACRDLLAGVAPELRKIAARTKRHLHAGNALIEHSLSRVFASCPANRRSDALRPLLGWLRGKSVPIVGGARATMAPLRLSPEAVGVAVDAQVLKAHRYRLRFDTVLQDRVQFLPNDTSSVVDDQVRRTATKALVSTGVRLQWTIPCCGCCGFSTEAAWILRGLRRYIEVSSPQAPDCHCQGGPQTHIADLWALYAPVRSLAHVGPDHEANEQVHVVVHHWDPVMASSYKMLYSHYRNTYRISRCMYEFSVVPHTWKPKILANYDELWVPSKVMARVLVQAGIPEGMITVIPEPIDTDFFDPAITGTVSLPSLVRERRWASARIGGGRRAEDALAGNFKFLSVFKMEPRKGWDALLKAYFTAFSADDRVSLYIVTHTWGELRHGATGPRDAGVVRWEILRYASESLGKFDWDNLPHVEIITEDVPDKDLNSIYATCDAFVLPTRGEGWGLPIIQAMALAKPVVTTRHSGMLEYTKPDTVMYVDVEEALPPPAARALYDAPEEAKWGEPMQEQLQLQMRRVLQMSADERRALGARARADVVERFSLDSVARVIAKRVLEIEKHVRGKWEVKKRETATGAAPTLMPAPRPTLAEQSEDDP